MTIVRSRLLSGESGNQIPPSVGVPWSSSCRPKHQRTRISFIGTLHCKRYPPSSLVVDDAIARPDILQRRSFDWRQPGDVDAAWPNAVSAQRLRVFNMSLATDDPAGPADGLRTLTEMGQADCRLAHFSVRDGRSFRRIDQEDRHEAIRQLELSRAVPETIRVHYDTARNVYLYAWHVYRFHVVAEHQALASLEMALRLAAFERGLVDGEGRPAGRPTAAASASVKLPRPLALAQLLTLARSEGLICNDRFTRRLQWAQDLADRRHSIEAIQFMRQENITEMTLSDDPPAPTRDELEFDWLADLVERLPKLRNEYAHGTQMLHATVLRTFEVVSDLVNQLWPPHAKVPAVGATAEP